jgi:hypothetical protein
MDLDDLHLFKIAEASPDDLPALCGDIGGNRLELPLGRRAFVGNKFIKPQVMVAVFMGKQEGIDARNPVIRKLGCNVRPAVDEKV